ncbi:MAG: zinc-ribbon domain-containing protein [Methanobrevibacter sp.]|nr:zinc-ribbon domain-containing protein [Methanobrevibacter sp.]
MSKFCPSCGEELVDNAKFCKNCGKNLENIENPQDVNTSQSFQVPVVENDHKAAVIVGYVLAVLIPLFGFIVGIYLVTRKDSHNAKKHGKYVIIVAAIVWFISFMLVR